MTRVVITDPLPFRPADLERLRSLGMLTAHTTMPSSEDELVARLRDHDVAIVGWCSLPAHVLESCPGLSLVSLWAAGADHVDLRAAAKVGILVTTASDYAATAVSEYAAASLVKLLRRIPEAARRMARGETDWRPFEGRDVASNGRVPLPGCTTLGLGTAMERSQVIPGPRGRASIGQVATFRCCRDFLRESVSVGSTVLARWTSRNTSM